MSRKARKHVLQALDGELRVRPGELLARVLEVTGSNVLRVETEEGEQQLVLIPSKYKGLTMFRRGALLMVELEADRQALSSKVVGLVSRPLSAHLLKQLRRERQLPEGWAAGEAREEEQQADSSAYMDASMLPPGSSEEEDELMHFSHRVNTRRVESSSSSSSSEE